MTFPAPPLHSLSTYGYVDTVSVATVAMVSTFQVIVEEERFKGQRGLKEGVYPHHLFHVYPLVVLQNLLPSVVNIETEVSEVIAFMYRYSV